MIIQKEKSLVNAVYRLTLEEQRIFHYAIAKVNPFKYRNDLMYEFCISDVIKFYSISSSDAYMRLHSALHKLFDRKCTYYDSDKETWITTHLVSRIADNKKGILGVSFNDEIGQLISADKDFLSYKLAQTVNITSPNANRLYEILLYSLQRCPVNKLNKNIGITELKKLMGLSGKYKVFAEFKRNVLEVSKSQINKHTDIRINYEVVKSGRTPAELKFIAQYTKNHEPGNKTIDLKQQEEIPLDELFKSDPALQLEEPKKGILKKYLVKTRRDLTPNSF